MKFLRHHLKLLIIENLWEIKYAIAHERGTKGPPLKVWSTKINVITWLLYFLPYFYLCFYFHTCIFNSEIWDATKKNSIGVCCDSLSLDEYLQLWFARFSRCKYPNKSIFIDEKYFLCSWYLWPFLAFFFHVNLITNSDKKNVRIHSLEYMAYIKSVHWLLQPIDCCAVHVSFGLFAIKIFVPLIHSFFFCYYFFSTSIQNYKLRVIFTFCLSFGNQHVDIF